MTSGWGRFSDAVRNSSVGVKAIGPVLGAVIINILSSILVADAKTPTSVVAVLGASIVLTSATMAALGGLLLAKQRDVQALIAAGTGPIDDTNAPHRTLRQLMLERAVLRPRDLPILEQVLEDAEHVRGQEIFDVLSREDIAQQIRICNDVPLAVLGDLVASLRDKETLLWLVNGIDPAVSVTEWQRRLLTAQSANVEARLMPARMVAVGLVILGDEFALVCVRPPGFRYICYTEGLVVRGTTAVQLIRRLFDEIWEEADKYQRRWGFDAVSIIRTEISRSPAVERGMPQATSPA